MDRTTRRTTWPAGSDGSCASCLILGANPDPYDQAELRLGITRAVLESVVQFDAPVVLATRSALIVRDMDLLAQLAKSDRLRVFVAIRTLDPAAAGQLEPGISTPGERLDAIRRLAAAGVQAGVLIAPHDAGTDETTVEAVLRAAADCGVAYADHAVLTPASGRRFQQVCRGLVLDHVHAPACCLDFPSLARMH
jgi:DNA repair photolyase